MVTYEMSEFDDSVQDYTITMSMSVEAKRKKGEKRNQSFQ